MLAACDEELLGEEIEGEELSLKVNEGFYKGRKVDGEELGQLINNYGNINLIGKETVEIAEGEKGELSKKYIGEVPHAIIITMSR